MRRADPNFYETHKLMLTMHELLVYLRIAGVVGNEEYVDELIDVAERLTAQYKQVNDPWPLLEALRTMRRSGRYIYLAEDRFIDWAARICGDLDWIDLDALRQLYRLHDYIVYLKLTNARDGRCYMEDFMALYDAVSAERGIVVRAGVFEDAFDAMVAQNAYDPRIQTLFLDWMVVVILKAD